MKIRRATYKIYAAVQRVIAPGLRFSQDLYEDVLKYHVGSRMKWLDVGCGHHVLPEWRALEEKKLTEKPRLIVGMDYDLESLHKHKSIALRVRGNIGELPFVNNSFDLVTANMVVEHLSEPEVQFREIKRILTPGGLFIFHTPNAYGYITQMARLIPEALKKKLINLIEGRAEEDVFETHYKANSINRIQQLAKSQGFEIVKLKMLVTDGTFALFPPLAVLELIWIKILMTERFASLRTNIIAVLRKASEPD